METTMNAIVVDDSRAMRGILKRTLVQMGYAVREACDGQDALTKLAEADAPAVALIDWNMPNMNGLELIKNIRKDSKFAGMRIMMVTTEVEMHQVESALTAGANEYVKKPFTEDGLREKVGMLMSTPEAA